MMLIKKIKFIILVLLINSVGTAIAQSIKFEKIIGNSGYDYGKSAQQTTDKGYIVGGSTSSFGSGGTDMYAFKTDSLGIPKFQKTFGGINIDIGTCIKQTSDKGFVILGYTNSFGAGGYDVYLVKTDSLLDTLWTKTYGGADWDFGNCVEQTTDGGYIICGATYSYGKGNEDYYLIKTNSNGDTIWTKTFGGMLEDVAKSVIQTVDGGYVLTGYSKSMEDTLGDFYTVKTNQFGDTVWTNKFGGIKEDYANDILESSTGEYVVVGETKSFGAGDFDAIILRISSLGISDSSLTDGGVGYENYASVVERVDGKIAATGVSNSYGFVNGLGDINFYIINPDWSYFYSKTFGNTKADIGYSIANTADKGFVLCGTSTSFNNGLEDIYLIKTDSMGISSGSVTNVIIGVQEYSQTKNKIILYPNPTNNLFTVKPSSDFKSDFTLTILNILGQTVFSKKYTSADLITINAEIMTEGVYLINISSDEYSANEKLIIQK